MKTNTISADLTMQVITCRVCNEQMEIPRRLLGDQHSLLVLVDHVQDDHRECAEYPDNPNLARLSREFRKRVHREQRKADTRHRVAA